MQAMVSIGQGRGRGSLSRWCDGGRSNGTLGAVDGTIEGRVMVRGSTASVAVLSFALQCTGT